MNNTIPELDKFYDEVLAYQNSNELKELYKFVSRFHRMAPFNAMLIYHQKPGSQYVASLSEWRNKFGRIVKPGARPLVILRPFGPVAFVFEYNDTEGKDLPNEFINPFRTEGDISDHYFNTLVDNLISDGIRYVEADYGTSGAGQIEPCGSREEVTITHKNKEIRIIIGYYLIINKAHSKTEKFATIIHELGHLYCGHCPTSGKAWFDNRTFLEKMNGNLKQKVFAGWSAKGWE